MIMKKYSLTNMYAQKCTVNESIIYKNIKGRSSLFLNLFTIILYYV